MLSNVVLLSDEQQSESGMYTYICSFTWIFLHVLLGWDGRETEMDTYSLQCTGQLTNENSLYQHRSPFQCSMVA